MALLASQGKLDRQGLMVRLGPLGSRGRQGQLGRRDLLEPRVSQDRQALTGNLDHKEKWARLDRREKSVPWALRE